jgi:hypothetical protein
MIILRARVHESTKTRKGEVASGIQASRGVVFLFPALARYLYNNFARRSEAMYLKIFSLCCDWVDFLFL